VVIELDPVDRITTGAVGEPGERTFFLQGRKGERLITVLVEKGQVQQLAAAVVRLLSRIESEQAAEPPELPMDLESPLEPEWRAGRLAIGYEENRDLLVLEVEELVPGAEDEEGQDEPAEGAPAEEGPEPSMVRFWATRDQMLALARHGAAVCAAGRPTCQFCGNPIDAEGHVCPAMNGHSELA
jgi:uncharacterized repeat protein (TIGR03847 family)